LAMRPLRDTVALMSVILFSEYTVHSSKMFRISAAIFSLHFRPNYNLLFFEKGEGAKTRGWTIDNAERTSAAEYSVCTHKNMFCLTIRLANSWFQSNSIQLKIILSKSESVLSTQ
jgi:hypothetical protein